MHKFAAFVDRSRFQAALVAVIAALLPLGGIVSGAVLGLVVLRHGMAAGAQSLAVASSILFLPALIFAGGQADQALGVVLQLMLWGLLAFVMASLLRATGSLAVCLQASIVVLSLLVLLFPLWVGDPAAWWSDQASQRLDLLAKNPQVGFDVEELRQQIEVLPFSLFTGIVAASLFLLGFVSLAFARSLHAVLENPGGFSREFRAIKLGKVLAIGTFIVAVASAMTEFHGVKNLVIVLTSLWMLKGLVLVHALAPKFQNPKPIITTAYMVLVISMLSGNPIVFVLVLIGLFDEFFGLRERFAH